MLFLVLRPTPKNAKRKKTKKNDDVFLKAKNALKCMFLLVLMRIN